MHLYHLHETPVTAMSFRLDAEGRVRSVPRCPNCGHFNFGFVLTDHIPPRTWLNAPHDLDVYV
jgi:ribosomal protein S27AE